jgi:tetratricopeptide (TPR) repeat protein
MENSYQQLLKSSNKTALQLLKHKDFPSAKSHLDRCLEIIKSRPIQETSKYIGITLNNYGCYYKRQGLLDKSLECFYRAVNANENTDSGPAEAYLNISNILSQQSDHYGALLTALKALNSLADSRKNTVTEVLTFKAIATEYEFLHMIKEASETYLRTFVLAKKVLGDGHRITNEVEKAYKSIKRLESFAPASGKVRNKKANGEKKRNCTPEPQMLDKSTINENLDQFVEATISKCLDNKSRTPVGKRTAQKHGASQRNVKTPISEIKAIGFHKKKRIRYAEDNLTPIPKHYKQSVSADRLQKLPS